MVSTCPLIRKFSCPFRDWFHVLQLQWLSPSLSCSKESFWDSQLMISWSMYDKPSAPHVPFWYPLCSSRNSPQLISEDEIFYLICAVIIFHRMLRVYNCLGWFFGGRVFFRCGWSFLLVIHSGMSVSSKDLFISIATQPWMEVNFLKPVSMLTIMTWLFPIWYFFF